MYVRMCVHISIRMCVHNMCKFIYQCVHTGTVARFSLVQYDLARNIIELHYAISLANQHV